MAWDGRTAIISDSIFARFEDYPSNQVNKRWRKPKGQSKIEQSRETGNIGYTRRRKTKQKHNTICVGFD